MSEMHKLTSYSDGFGIFNKVAEHEFDVDNKNYLRLFMLNTENKLFNYDELYEYLLPNIARYVFDRKRLAEAEKNPVKQSLILIEAIEHLRKITSDKDRGAGGELGEVLLYLFLEQDLKAPKLFSKVELKTSNMDYVKGSDGIHYRFRTTDVGKKVLQLIIGEAKIKNSLQDAIKEAFLSIDAYLTYNIQDRLLLDTHLLNQFADEEEAAELKDYIITIPRKKKETVFGIFIGYSIEYQGESDTNDEYDQKVIEKNITQVLAQKKAISHYQEQDGKLVSYDPTYHLEKYNGSANHKNQVINEAMKDIEQIINYKFSMYFLRFSEAIIKIRGEKALINDWYEYVEYGTCNEQVIGLQKHGFLREQALLLTKNPYSAFVAYLDGQLKISSEIFEVSDEDMLETLGAVRINYPEIFVDGESE